MIGGAEGARKAGPPPAADAWALRLLFAACLAAAGVEAMARVPRPGAAAPPVAEAIACRVDLATAGEAELRLLPGVGPRLARRIAAERAARGAFASPEDLARRVPGVGAARVRRWEGRLAPTADREDR